MMTTHQYEITVIGGGPVGMFATFYAGLRSADVLLVESLANLGGQPYNLYPAKKLYDIAGFVESNGQALTEQLQQQLEHFNPEIRLATMVTAINQLDDGSYELETTTGTISTKTVIIATGGGAFNPRKLAIDYPPSLEETHIHYFVRDLEQFRDTRVAIAGGGDSAIDWALALEPIASEVHLIHRRNEFRGLESSVDALKNSRVILHTPYLISDLRDTDPLTLELKKVRGDNIETLTVDHLLVNYGFMSDNKQLRNWDLTLDRTAIAVNSQMMTNRPGIFAIGDAAAYPGKLALIASGFGEAPIAVSQALGLIHPDMRQALHSSQLYH
ncbi:NAD(P)/FAD-dependent oxidoreductase [Lacticaseibacillus saniviri]